MGRFISVDPMGFDAGDTNLYRYVSNNSTNATDPSGLLKLYEGNPILEGLEAANTLLSSGFGPFSILGGKSASSGLFQPAIDALKTNELVRKLDLKVEFDAGEKYGDAAAEFYATKFNDPDVPLWQKPFYFAGGTFASLWTTKTSDATFAVLSTAWTGAKDVKKLGQWADDVAKRAGSKKNLNKLGNQLDDLQSETQDLIRQIDNFQASPSRKTIPANSTADDAWLKFNGGKNGTQCFIAGTEIQTLNGTKNIEDIRVGDWVLSDDPTTVGEIEYKQVLNTFVKEATNLIDVYIDGEKITTTEEHPFWVPDVGWVAAKDLNAGSYLQTKYESWLDVDLVVKHSDTATVYNFEVEGFHTYFVSDLGLLVHNECNNPRNLPGVVEGGSNLPTIGDKWLRGSQGNLGEIPKQIGDRLAGQNFKNFDEFREKFWTEVGNDSNLASQFSQSNQSRMKKGLAPFASKSQQLGGQVSYTIHHKTPIHDGGAVYNLDNLVVVTPKFHTAILKGSYHYGKQ